MEQTRSSRKIYTSIDLFKAFSAIMIIFLHANTLSISHPFLQAQIVQLFSRLGVPFFFITSAFLLSKKLQAGSLVQGVKTTKSYVYRLLKLYAFWIIVNLPLVYSEFFVNIKLPASRQWTLLVLNTLLSDTFPGSWYVTASIFSAIFVFVILRKRSTWSKILICLPFYVVVVLASLYARLLPQNFMLIIDNPAYFYLPTTILTGPFYFVLGEVLAKYEEVLVKQRLSLISVGLIFSWALLDIEDTFAVKNNWAFSTDQSFLLAPTVFLLMIFLIKMPSFKLYGDKTIRKFSTVAYFSQFWVLARFGATFYGMTRIQLTQPFIFGFAVLWAVALTYFLEKISQKQENPIKYAF